MREEIDPFTALNAYYSLVLQKYLFFTVTILVNGSTHSVLLPMNVILGKECEESNSPTPKK